MNEASHAYGVAAALPHPSPYPAYPFRAPGRGRSIPPRMPERADNLFARRCDERVAPSQSPRGAASARPSERGILDFAPFSLPRPSRPPFLPPSLPPPLPSRARRPSPAPRRLVRARRSTFFGDSRGSLKNRSCANSDRTRIFIAGEKSRRVRARVHPTTTPGSGAQRCARARERVPRNSTKMSTSRGHAGHV